MKFFFFFNSLLFSHTFSKMKTYKLVLIFDSFISELIFKSFVNSRVLIFNLFMKNKGGRQAIGQKQFFPLFVFLEHACGISY